MAAQLPTAEEIRAIVREELRAVLDQLRPAGPLPVDDMTTAAAAARAKVSRETILDWIKSKGLPAHRPPGARAHLIRRADLEAFLANPSARRPPPARGPLDLAAEARRILRRQR